AYELELLVLVVEDEGDADVEAPGLLELLDLLEPRHAAADRERRAPVRLVEGHLDGRTDRHGLRALEQDPAPTDVSAELVHLAVIGSLRDDAQGQPPPLEVEPQEVAPLPVVGVDRALPARAGP